MEKAGGKFVLEWDMHSKHVTKGFCMLIERQSLVDVAICCGSNTLHAHKCVLAANSSYFKDFFENRGIEQVIINGLDYAVVKALVEFMYCGECAFAEDLLKHFAAAAKFFKISALETVFSESEYQNISADEICIPPPQFICKPPKYPTVFKPFSNPSLPPKVNFASSSPYGQHKLKRKFLGNEAEKACAKEAQASHFALANLRKVMTSSPQLHSFIVEESFNETTVENFIPSVEDNFENVDVQFVNENSSEVPKALTIPGDNQGLTADKIKHILGNSEVEIMFQTSDGNFVNVSDEVLLNLSKGPGLQYQVVDENGRLGEVQELKTIDKEGEHKNEVEECEMKTREEPKTIRQEYIDRNFKSIDAAFNDDIYMQGTGIFEPENLTLHSELMDNAMEFGPSSELKYKFSPSKVKHGLGESTLISENINNTVLCQTDEIDHEPKDAQNKPMLKFSPDMFFADLPQEVRENSKDN